MLWIVGGPTSVGKSTFIGSPRCAEITGLPFGTPIVWPAKHSLLDENGRTDLLYHYNILRPPHLKLRAKRPAFLKLLKTKPTLRNATDFNQDPRWNDLAARGVDKKAIVLVTSKQTIMQRVRQREVIESSEPTNSNNHYPARYWLDLLRQVNLVVLYRAWCRELRTQGIPYTLVDSSDDAYPIIEDEDRLPAILRSSNDIHPATSNGARPVPPTHGAESGYTKEQIEKILREHRFDYHRVNLPFGLHTPGADRSETRDLILPESLAGKTVLDIGSALGYFCFEAEERGAERVVGVELKDDRFRDALMLKDIKGSKVEFLQRDIILDPPNEGFDYVLLLNVIHHLTEPFRAMRQLASITRERLVIEFPTFADQKFRSTVEIEDPSIFNRLPLVGVSSMTEAKQTFVFTPKAIKRALLNHERLFEDVEIIRSPMQGRALAICHKKRASDHGSASHGENEI